MTVRDVMTTSVVSVRAVTPLKEVAQTLIDHRISGVPVVDDAGRVVGVVSEGDFLFKDPVPRPSVSAAWRASSVTPSPPKRVVRRSTRRQPAKR